MKLNVTCSQEIFISPETFWKRAIISFKKQNVRNVFFNRFWNTSAHLILINLRNDTSVDFEKLLVSNVSDWLLSKDKGNVSRIVSNYEVTPSFYKRFFYIIKLFCNFEQKFIQKLVWE